MSKYPSRAKRLSEAESQVEEAKSVVEELRDELQTWLDNLPVNLQSSNKADMLNDAIIGLDEIISNLESCYWSIDFPGMFS